MREPRFGSMRRGRPFAVAFFLLVAALALLAGAGAHPTHDHGPGVEAEPRVAASAVTRDHRHAADGPHDHRPHHDGTRADCPICLALCLAHAGLPGAEPELVASCPCRVAAAPGVPIEAAAARTGFRLRAPPIRV